MEYVPLALWGHFRVHEDDVRDVTGKSDGELMKADFRGITSESDIEPMLSCNQVKVSENLQRQRRGEISAEVLTLREKKGFSLEGKDNQQKTYDNETGEHTSRQGLIFIQDWQAHLGNKEYGSDKQVGDVRACAHCTGL